MVVPFCVMLGGSLGIQLTEQHSVNSFDPASCLWLHGLRTGYGYTKMESGSRQMLDLDFSRIWACCRYHPRSLVERA